MSDVSSTVPASAHKNGVSRRQLVRAGVWAAPAVAVAIATPAATASVTGASLVGTQQAGASARSWNLALNIAGTAGTRTWSVQAITSGAPLTITSIPATVSTGGTSNGVLTLTNWSSTATVFFRLTNGSTTLDSNAISVTSPPPPVTTSAPTRTAGSGNGSVVSVSATSLAPVSVTAVAAWVRASGNGQDGNAGWDDGGTKTGTRVITQDVTSAATPFTFPRFVKHASSSTYTITITFSYTAGGAVIGSQSTTF